jgi:REP element-mobilizing transposase RayT
MAPQPPKPAPLVIRQGAYLPHWTREGATYAITFRLADSLPQSVLKAWVIERDHIIARARSLERDLTKFERDRLDELHSDKIEKYLDAGHGQCLMKDNAVARIVLDAMRFFEGKRHDIIAWCVMPNHVHAVIRPLPGFELPAILKSWKGFSAHEINKLLNRDGPVWQPESYDHLVRDEADFAHCVRYVLDNPTKAGLENWPWVGSKAVVARVSDP